MTGKELRNLQESYFEMYNPERLDEISQKTATKAYASSKTGEFEGQDSPRDVRRTDRLGAHIKRKFGAKAGEHADRAADAQTFGRKDASGRRKQSPQPRIQTSDHENQREFKRELRIRRDRRLRAARGEDTNEQVDIYDIILSHLLDEGYADTQEAAEVIMVNMSEEWIDSIVDDVLTEGEKPFPYQKVDKKQASLRSNLGKDGKSFDRAVKMGMAKRRAKEAEKTGGSQQDAGKGWYHGR